MTLLERLLSRIAYRPDDGTGSGGADPAAADPAAAAAAAAPAADPAAGGDPAAPAAGAADPAASDPAAAARPHGNAGRQPWYMARINEETNRRHAEANARAAAEQRARDAEEMLARLQNNGQQPPAGQQQQPAAQPQRGGAQPANEDELNRVIHQTARAISTAERLQEDSTSVMQTGFSQFPDWADSVNTLKAIGITSDEIVSDVIAIDKANAHVIFDKLAKDPEKAVLLTQMNPRQRIVEITRMATALSPNGAPGNGAQPAANGSPAAVVAAAASRRLSNAPAPPPPVAPAAATQKRWDSDDVSDEEFSMGYNEKYLSNGAAR